MITQLRGLYFSIEGDQIEIFGLPGAKIADQEWIIGFMSCEGLYVFTENECPTAFADVLKVLSQYEQHHTENTIELIVSSSVAVKLWLDGTLVSEAFLSAREESDNRGKKIILESISISGYRVSFTIIPNSRYGSSFIKYHVTESDRFSEMN